MVLSLLSSVEGWAQCGSVGDPIVNITFGTRLNPDFGGGTTTYHRNEQGELNDGEYKLGSNGNQGRESWHNLRDHTHPNEEGMMLLVNASYDTGEFYRIRVSGLCQDTRFRFSAWIANVNNIAECDSNALSPNVRFVIEDLNGNAVSLPYVTGNIPPSATPQWQPYGFEFDTGNQTEFYLVLINENPGGCGNDLAIDDIQFRPCGPEITLDAALTRGTDTIFFCEESASPIAITSAMEASEAYATAPAFQWQTRYEGQTEWQDIPGETGASLTIRPVHYQWYRVTAAASKANLDNRLCRVVSDSLVVIRDTVHLAPMEDLVISPGQQISLHPQTNGTQFHWHPAVGLSNATVRNPVAYPTETTTYQLMVSNTQGCYNVALVTVRVLPELILPNTFTPNGDGINDTWVIAGLDEYPSASVQVFNRWGALVFSSEGYQAPWDGQSNGAQLPTGTYYYIISSKLLTRPLTGSVTMLK
ncbi:gliding motility-associated C-terminal domain-containing protein [Parapedobacter koreensis]|uniref:gliding motility-associated C-terminal domain-containing protein n=1 Tax=Parapedobacter koreensis TaxID=332977 RepID=UPI0015A70776|nr:gliding motility-associated C-terminal domain-containing protein [Parapedobacter koreensis]